MRYAALLIGLLLGLPASAQTPTPVTWSLRLMISANDVIRDRLTSCVNGGLRKLGYVSLVEGESILTVGIVAMQHEIDGSVFGYTASIVAMDNQGVNMMRLSAKKDFERVLLEDSGRLIHHVVLAGPDDLAQLCDRIVANLDVNVIEAKRKSSAWVLP